MLMHVKINLIRIKKNVSAYCVPQHQCITLRRRRTLVDHAGLPGGPGPREMVFDDQSVIHQPDFR